MAPPDLKKMLQVKIKPRQDSYTDQFSRILMAKVMMMTAAITGISWMKDKLTCIVPKNHDVTGGFVSKACWINGLYVYRGLKTEDESFYYGIPHDISYDGINKYGTLCSTRYSANLPGSCQAFEKTFFLQYQWFPIGVAALSFLYYLPYLLFRVVNADMNEVKDAIKDKKVDEVNYAEVIKTFFSRKAKTSISHLRARVLLNIVIKVLYVVVNLVSMLIIDYAVNGNFMNYGPDWASWTGRSNEGRHDYTSITGETKAGQNLLPSFGLCQVQSSGQDVKNTVINVQTYVCELSQHILYQYILLVLWYALVFGIIVSIVGLMKHIYSLVANTVFVDAHGTDVNKAYKHLTAREKEYMNFIRRKNMAVFGELIKKLNEKFEKYGQRSPSESDRSSYDITPYNEKESLMMS